MKNKKENFKKRSPYWRTLRKLSNQLIPSKKGRGSYVRMIKHKEKCYDC
jgi:stalled ribosome alternative rescue factor ArfA